MPGPSGPASKPARKKLPAPDVRQFRAAVEQALKAKRPKEGGPYEAGEAAISSTKWGVYAFYDYEGEPIYVGQTNESLRTRIRRHLTNQRTDAVGMRVLDPYEILDLEMWPLLELQYTAAKDVAAKLLLNRLERTIYERAIAASQYGVILNEKIPPDVPVLNDAELPPNYRFTLVPDEVRAERMHPDNRIARRGESLGRLVNVVRERGEVTNDLRRVVVVQAIRLAWLGAQRLAEAEGREPPDYGAVINLQALVGGAERLDVDPEDLDSDA